ncbi:LamG-like jellyroll fold domain-containing protein [Sedimentisphaera salicampi]|uniref:LamG-like jellyroll fold domain-containing protein n=1 Tax=Sedimentisphaera salicampi TaxID=1941349 RepID=UPI000B9C60CA|nr:LamG-like jellyroll fold domain-containing protein [Sedimentisphaera salicampi]OXU15552.1 Immunoglobulin I-set domain protein [Sedimentisphaera salicampi]
MKRIKLFSILMLISFVSVQAANIITNPDFDLDGTGSESMTARGIDDALAWEGTGYTNVVVPTDQGAPIPPNGKDISGRISYNHWTAILSQETTHTIQAGKVYELTFNSYPLTWTWGLYVELFAVDGSGAVGVYSQLDNSSGTWKSHQISFDIADKPEIAGKELGIRLRNVQEGGGGRVMVTNFVLDLSNKPYDPSVSQTAQANSVDADLSWQAAPDINDEYAVNPDIVDQYVFMTTGGEDPNLYYVGAAGEDPGTEDPSSEYTVSGLNYDTSYQWAVVEAVDGYEQSFTAGLSELEDVDENNIIGPVWSFDSLSSVPVILSQPADVLKDAGEDAELSVEVSSVSPEQYLWYKSDDNSNETPEDDVEAGSTSNILSLADMAAADEGFYYCVITNDGGTTTSSVAKAAVKRQMAHWTFDQADYSGGQYLDVSTDDDVYHPADPNGTPAFNAGIDGDSVLIDEVNSWAQAGTWDPSKYSNQLTVSAWVKWDGDTASHKGIVSKRDSWDSGMRWSLIIRNEFPGGTVRFYNNSGLSAWTGESLPIDEWTLVTATFDGSEGKVYFNGLEKASDSGSLSSGAESMIMLGAVDNPSVNEEFDPLSGSELDDVQILNYAADKFAVADMYYDVTGVKSCILDYESQLDVANSNTGLVIGQEGFEPDCVIDISDFAALAGNWLSCGLYPECP